MKELLFQSKSKLIKALSARLSLLGVNYSQEVESRPIGIIPKSHYLSFERTYKVISKKELLAIVENEKHVRSPFDNSYVMYRTSDIGDGSWLVKYYFIDLNKYPQVGGFKLVILWDDVAQYLLTKHATERLVMETPFGRELAIISGGQLHFAEAQKMGLKERLLLSGEQEKHKEIKLNTSELFEEVSAYVLGFSWLSLNGGINYSAFKTEHSFNFFTPQVAKYAGLILSAAIGLQSAFLLASGYYMDSVVASGAEQRKTYASLKRGYLDNLDAYSQLSEIVSSKSHASSIPNLLHGYQGKDGLRIDRLDYLSGEVRIGGVTDNTDGFMAYLSSHTSVSGLEFMSPITPDRSGKDRFSIKFEFLNDK